MDASSPAAVRGRSSSNTAQVIHLERARARIPRARPPIVRLSADLLDTFLMGLLIGVLAAGGLAVLFLRAGAGS